MMNQPSYSPQPSYPQGAPSPFGPPPSAPAPSASVPLVLAWLAAAGAFGLGVIAFLIAGFEGHSAGWELLAIPTALSFGAAMVAGIASIVAIVRKSLGGGIGAIGLSAFGVLLALIGFVLGA